MKAAFIALTLFFSVKAGHILKVQLREPIKVPSNHPVLSYESEWKDWYLRVYQRTGNLPNPSSGSLFANTTLVIPVVQNASLPLFVIAGVQKAGTTFIRALMGMHPMLSSGVGYSGKCGGENHFFDLEGTNIGVELQAKDCIVFEDGENDTYSGSTSVVSSPSCLERLARTAQGYTRHHFKFPTCDGFLPLNITSNDSLRQTYFFDTTPKYLLGIGNEIAPPTDEHHPICSNFVSMKAILAPNTPIVILLRDPVQRYRSGLAMSQCKGSRFATQGRALDTANKQHSSFVETWHTDWVDGATGPFSSFTLAQSRRRALLNEDKNGTQKKNKIGDSKYHNRFGNSNSGSMQRYIAEYSALEREMWDSGISVKSINQKKRQMKAFWPLLRSRYSLLIRRFFEVFPREQLYAIRSEDLFSNPIVIAELLSKRVGLPPADFKPEHILSLDENKFSSPCDVKVMMDTSEVEELHSYLSRSGDTNLTNLLGYHIQWP